MRAVVMRSGALVVDDVVLAELQPGQVRAEVLACGICGSDLHALEHADELVEMSTAVSGGLATPTVMNPGRDVVMGHEFAARVLEVGDDVGNCDVDDIVVSLPVVLDATGVHAVGYSNEYPGGFAEQILLSDVLTMKVPNGLDPHLASLTEPMAVGLHAVEMSRVTPRHSSVVLGCGPVGLAVIAALRLAGVETIVAADFSPARRTLATTMGATEVVDPSDEPAVEAWRRVDGSRPLVIFEAVGVPGMLDAAISGAPAGSQILVVGVCMVADSVRPGIAVVKELNLQFVFGYDPLQFGTTLRRIAEGELDVAPMVTGRVGLDGVATAFEALRDPEAHAKVLVLPGSDLRP